MDKLKIIGQRITELRPMTAQEQTDYRWYKPGIVIVLEDGTKLIPIKDREANGPGELDAATPDGTTGLVVPA